jgi:aerobic-type carbon monoxide dehydrogenase small subunit (CoxS/CutS family)
MPELKLSVNGVAHTVQTEPGETLLDLLRHRLQLTGAKYGCGEGQCGACVVWLEGRAMRACIVPAMAAAGKRVTTIEGLAPEGNLHPVQRAFLEAEAFQCGYCTPGMVMGAAALLQSEPQPSRDRIREALEGHLCRCGTYPRIVAAVELASRLKGAADSRD